MLALALGAVAPGKVQAAEASGQDAPVVHHELRVVIDVAAGTLAVTDRLRFPEALRERDFFLNSGLTITAADVEVSRLRVRGGRRSAAAAAGESNGTRYRLRGGRRGFTRAQVEYEGVIAAPGPAPADAPAGTRGFARRAGIIDERGVFLSGASAWLPSFIATPDEGERPFLASFDMEVRFDPPVRGWVTIGQGELIADRHWRQDRPQAEVYLLAGPFQVIRRPLAGVEALAYLRPRRAQLADRWLDAAQRQLDFYQDLFGDYPHATFAVVDDLWENAYSPPALTLLGERVLRPPPVINSPHSHGVPRRWWGGGVRPDEDSGNWREGLATYLSDHLVAEADGRGGEYRRELLATYRRDALAAAGDFPLGEFSHRDSAAAQAVGRGKALMVWHMLRRELGDETFLAGLRRFYAQYRFQQAAWGDLEELFSAVGGRNLSGFFAQWLNRAGAPKLSVRVVEERGNRARIMLAQTQFDEPYAITVPVALYYEGQDAPYVYDLTVTGKLEGYTVDGHDRLRGVWVDPGYDVFRQLEREEAPPVLGELLAAERLTIVLPPADREPWRQLATALAGSADARIVAAEDLAALPADRSVWLLGRDNPFLPLLTEGIAGHGVAFDPAGLSLAGGHYAYAGRSTVLVGQHPGAAELTLGWLHGDDLAVLAERMTELPHYGRYSYLSFPNAEAAADLAGTWTPAATPMRWTNPQLDGGDFTAPPRKPALAGTEVAHNLAEAWASAAAPRRWVSPRASAGGDFAPPGKPALAGDALAVGPGLFRVLLLGAVHPLPPSGLAALRPSPPTPLPEGEGSQTGAEALH